nr:helix-turn-helix domain protein [uncultured bacterium]
MSISIFLADDHQVVRKGVAALLETERDLRLVGEARTGQDTLRLVEKNQPDILILDLMMPGLNGLEVARLVRQRSPATRIVILSMHKDEAYVVEALQAGALAYVLKDAGLDEIVRAIRQVLAGQRYLSPPLSDDNITSYMDQAKTASLDRYQTLTAREREILQLTAEGLSGVEIGERLFISPRTVESHRANMMRKLRLRNQRQLVRYAMERGLLSKNA